MSVGKRVQELRLQHHDLQADIADRLNVPVRTYASWEREERAMPSDIVVQIAQFYGVSTDYLLGMEKAAQRELDGRIDTLTRLASRLTPVNQEKLHSYLLFLLEREQPDSQGLSADLQGITE